MLSFSDVLMTHGILNLLLAAKRGVSGRWQPLESRTTVCFVFDGANVLVCQFSFTISVTITHISEGGFDGTLRRAKICANSSGTSTPSLKHFLILLRHLAKQRTLSTSGALVLVDFGHGTIKP